MPEPKPEWEGGKTPVPEPMIQPSEPAFATGGGGAPPEFRGDAGSPPLGDWRDLVPANRMPIKVALFFQCVDRHHGEQLEEQLDKLIGIAESAGFYFDWAASNEMELSEVPDGSSLQNDLLTDEPGIDEAI